MLTHNVMMGVTDGMLYWLFNYFIHRAITVWKLPTEELNRRGGVSFLRICVFKAGWSFRDYRTKCFIEFFKAGVYRYKLRCGSYQLRVKAYQNLLLPAINYSTWESPTENCQGNVTCYKLRYRNYQQRFVFVQFPCHVEVSPCSVSGLTVGDEDLVCIKVLVN